MIIATCAFKSNELTISYALLAADIRVRKLHVNLHYDFLLVQLPSSNIS